MLKKDNNLNLIQTKKETKTCLLFLAHGFFRKSLTQVMSPRVAGAI